MGEPERELGLLGATDIGIGALIGAGVFVLSGVAAGLAGPGVIIAFALSGIVALLTALSSAELSSLFPRREVRTSTPRGPSVASGALSMV
jgi:APA family basic amino acid/polyamine antiporter